MKNKVLEQHNKIHGKEKPYNVRNVKQNVHIAAIGMTVWTNIEQKSNNLVPSENQDFHREQT